MRKIRKLLFLFIFLLVFLGTTNVYAKNKNISVEKIEIIDKSSTINVDDLIVNKNAISSNIIFNNIDDYVTFKLTIKNNYDSKYKLASVKDNGINNNIKVSFENNGKYISSGKTGIVNITLSYSNKLLNVDSIDLDNLVISLNFINENGDSSEVIINNPATGDNIVLYVVLFILVVCGLIFINKTMKIKNIKIGGLVVLISVFAFPFVAFAVDDFKVELKFTKVKIIGEYEKYNIKFDLNEGTLPIGDVVNDKVITDKDGNKYIETIVTYGEKLGELPGIPEKDGYKFLGWYTESGKKVNSNTIIKKEEKIIAKFELIKYTITYELDDGEAVNKEEYTVEDEFTLNNPSKQGYTFVGWFGSNSENIEENVTVKKGTTGNLTFIANFLSKTDTPYKVIHRIMNLDGKTYTEVIEHLKGTTGSSITPTVKEYQGFTSPSSKTAVIKADGTTEVIYAYTRNKYHITVLNYDYVEEGNLSNDYYYGSKITLTAKDRNRYSFIKWSNGRINKKIEYTVFKDATIEPIYEVNTIKVIFDANKGTVGETVRNVEVERSIGELPTAKRDRYVFKGWFTSSTGGDKIDETFIPTVETTLYAHWEDMEFDYVFRHDGECTFNGDNGVITGDNCLYANGTNKYIDTGINLYNKENHDLDYEIGFTIVSYDPNLQDSSGKNQQTFMNSKLEGDNYPGLVVRRSEYSVNLASRSTKSANKELLFYYENVKNIRIYRIHDELGNASIYYSINGGNRVLANSLLIFNPVFDLPVWFGAAPVDKTCVEAQRYLTGTLSNMYIKVGMFNGSPVADTFTVYLDSNGGNEDLKKIVVNNGDSINSLPTPTRNGYIFKGWYRGATTGVEVELPFIPEYDRKIYAKWEKQNNLAVSNGVYYTNVQSAIDAAPAGEKTTITLLRDVYTTGALNIDNKNVTRDIVLDLNGFTLSNNNSNSNIIKTKASTIEVKNGTIISGASGGAIDVSGTGKFIINSGSIIAIGSRQAIYNNGGTVLIGGSAYIENNTSERAAVQNQSGTLKITGGKIVAKKQNAVYVKAGTFTLGDIDNPYTNNIVLEGKNYGISSDVNYQVYDGIIKGNNGPVNDESRISKLDNTVKVTYNETIAGLNYSALYYKNSDTINTVVLNANGGTVSVPSITVTSGSVIGDLPVPTPEDGKTFSGWYTGLTDGEEVTNTYIVSNDIVIYARYNDSCRGFATESWTNIKTNIDLNQNYYGVGCTKEVELDLDGSLKSYTLRIANTSTPNICSRSGYSQTACGVVLEFVDVLPIRQMNNVDDVDGGYYNSTLVTWLNSELYNKLPEDLRNIIIPTYPIVSGSGNKDGKDGAASSPIITDTDTDKNKIYVSTGFEFGLINTFDNKNNEATDTRTLDYYRGTATVGDSFKRIKSDINGNRQKYWTRTPRKNSTDTYYLIDANGADSYGKPTDSYGVVPLFRISSTATQKTQYIVTFNANGGEVSPQTVIVNVDNQIGTLPNIVPPEGKTFVGWYTLIDGGLEVTSTFIPNNDITVFARFSDN